MLLGLVDQRKIPFLPIGGGNEATDGAFSQQDMAAHRETLAIHSFGPIPAPVAMVGAQDVKRYLDPVQICTSPARIATMPGRAATTTAPRLPPTTTRNRVFLLRIRQGGGGGGEGGEPVENPGPYSARGVTTMTLTTQ